MEDHWFDVLNKALLRENPRRTLLGAAAPLASLGTPLIALAKKGKGKGKGKGKNNKNKNKRKADRKPCKGGLCLFDPTCCEAGLRCCDGQCVDVFDDNHCGACNNPCSPGKICFGGECECMPGLTECDGICRDTQRDENFCGGCNVSPCTGEGRQCCGGACLDTRHNDRHCGRCDNACTGPGGNCCDGNCFDSRFDSNHCGFLCLDCPDGFECCHGRCINSATLVCCRDHTLEGSPTCPIAEVCCTNPAGAQDCC